MKKLSLEMLFNKRKRIRFKILRWVSTNPPSNNLVQDGRGKKTANFWVLHTKIDVTKFVVMVPGFGLVGVNKKPAWTYHSFLLQKGFEDFVKEQQKPGWLN